jgi:hypothetical protein
MSSKYVLLTGSKKNAGDFLIKYRAKELLQLVRPDRDLVDIDRFEELTDKQLETVNESKALILCGGPSMRIDMYPKIYPLRKNLDDIKVPIITLGTGYKDQNGEWYNVSNYEFSETTRSLLDRIENSGFQSGVRDYNTLNALRLAGYRSFVMTGCPATYHPASFDKVLEQGDISTIRFSLGVTFRHGKAFMDSMLSVMKACHLHFKDKDFKVLFHHKLNPDNKDQQQIIDFLEAQNIAYKDISGTAEKLIAEYSSCDLHIGYRVHAHIFMSSISKRSILINEDGRGKALLDVIGGVRLDSYTAEELSLQNRVKAKLDKDYNFLRSISKLEDHVLNAIEYEIEHQFPRVRKIRSNINDNFGIMKSYLEQLP